MCQCAQRRAVIRQAVSGQVGFAPAVSFVAISVMQDLRAVAAKSAALAAAKAALRR